MVQEFHVLRCFSCQTFQVQQVKKAKKWNCKMCGEKQSVIKEYGRGTGADCRRHVQKLNGLRGQLLEEEDESAWSRWGEDEVSEFNYEDQELSSNPQQNFGESRWSKYVETAEPSEDAVEEDENIYTESTRFVSQRNVRKRKRGGRGRFGAGGFGGGGGGGDPEGDQEDYQGQDTGSWSCQRGSWKRKRGGRGRFGAGGFGDPEGEEAEDQGQDTASWRRHRGSWKRKRGGQGRFGDPEGEEEEDRGQGAWRRGSWKQRAGSRPTHYPAAMTTDDCAFSTPSFHSNTPTPSAASKAPPSHIPSRSFHHPQQQHRPSQPGSAAVTTESRASCPTSAPTRRTPLAETPVNKGTSVSSLKPVAKVGQSECKSSSKWAKFLTVASVEDQEEGEQQQEEKEEEDWDGTAHWSDLDEPSESNATSWSGAYRNPAAPVTSKAPVVDFRANKREETCSSGLFFGAVPTLAKGASGVADKVKSAAACFGFSSAASQVPSPAFTAKTIRQEEAVNQQPRPSKRPCTGLGGVSSLFQTDEDFDITF